MEMMVVLLIVAIVAAASAPMINKKVTSLQGDGDCLWTSENAGISYNSASSDNIAVMIGASDRNIADTKLHIVSNNPTMATFARKNNNTVLRFRLGGSGFSITDSDTDLTGAVVLGTGITQASGTAVVIGQGAGANEASVAVGTTATASSTPSVAIGNHAEASSSGATAVGSWARALHTSSTAIGEGAQTTAANQIVLGTADSTVFIPGTLRVDGNTELGRSEQDGELRIYSNRMGEYYEIQVDAGPAGNRVIGIPTTMRLESDRRLKNVGERFTAGLEEVNKLDLYNYTYKKDEAKTPHVGVIAQDLMKIFPNAVNKGEDGYYRIRMEDMFYAAINSIKELDLKFTEIKEQIKTFLDKVTAVETSVEELKATIATQQETIDAQQKAIEAQQKALDDLTKKVEKLSKKKTAEEPKAEVKVEE